MDLINHFRSSLFNINEDNFDRIALNLFQYQAQYNDLYRSYLDHLGVNPASVQKISEIPFLPIEFFKNHVIKTRSWPTQKIFKSSGTTSTGRSQHHIDNLAFYHDISWRYAKDYFGDLSETRVIALLPSYLEQGDSSLIEMVNYFILHANKQSGFYLNELNELAKELMSPSGPIMLFGVTYALIDLAEKMSDISSTDLIIVETGGMKGRKKEITSMEVHSSLKSTFINAEIHSEYGMTELLSQAYGIKGELRFPAWARPFVRDLNDPFSVSNAGSGGLNIIDLANIHSIAFIETKDLAEVDKDQKFRILGRMDNSDIRGCSLLI
jgi:hypothetical protein